MSLAKPTRSNLPIPLTIAGSDPSGGAGVEADLKVFLRHGLSGASVITALTWQGPGGVRDVTPVKIEAVRNHLQTLLDEMPIGAVKTGILSSPRMIAAVARSLRERSLQVVVDPVIASTSGFIFLDGDGVRALRHRLLPVATIVAPNLDEAAYLSELDRALVEKEPELAIQKLHAMGPRWVLLKGGHASGPTATDYLSDGETIHELRLPRLPVRAHGTGCALTAAIVARLTLGDDMVAAATAAKRYVHRAMRKSRVLSAGRAYLEFMA
ncbi:MAG: bifunctional hydroxymethylpyrimidine kinase/phosphomethylpyrimidine kinase [Planctomycetota bacterium]